MPRSDLAQALFDNFLDRESERIDKCGVKIMPLRCRECSTIYAAKYRCKLRCCFECSKKYGINQAKKFESFVGHLRRKGRLKQDWSLKMWTFTLAHVGTIEERAYRLHQAYNEMWDQLFKRGKDAGAICVIEISGDEHVHLHVCYYGPFIPQKLVSNTWLAVTGDSWVVDVQAGDRSDFERIWYAVKYVSKGIDSEEPYLLAAKAHALKGKRRIWTKGIFYRMRATINLLALCPWCDQLTSFYPSFEYLFNFMLIVPPQYGRIISFADPPNF